MPRKNKEGVAITYTWSARSFTLAAFLLICLFLLSWMIYRSHETTAPEKFVQANGRQLVQNGEPVRLKSISFSNYYSYELGEDGFSLQVSTHHSERDFKRVSDIGFNSIRFAINGNWYQSNPEAFWLWLDQNVSWADKYGVMLTLDLHVPIGGFWLAPNADNVDFRIWTDKDIRQQNIELWTAIAERYKNETSIAAYEILNEAVTDDASGDQWRNLADELVKAIREVDENHLLIVGAIYGTNRRYSDMGRKSQFLVNDSNVMYDFHFYEPIAFTHQNASWVDKPMGDGGNYPDYKTPIPTGNEVLLSDSSISSKSLVEGDTGWLKYESDWTKLKNPDAIAGLPIMVLRSGARGTANLDNVEVMEYDIKRRSFSKIVNDPLTKDGVWQWWGWGDADQAKSPSIFTRSGANGQYNLRIDGATTSEEYLGWSSDSHWFKATPGNLYKISGYMKGSGIAYSAPYAESEAFIGLELNFYSEQETHNMKGFLYRDKGYLESEFLKMYKFGVEENVPMSVMEFGTIRDTFEIEGKGGAIWVADALEVFRKYDTSFSLWNYHGSSMGLFLSDFGYAPDEPNLKLIEVLEDRLAD